MVFQLVNHRLSNTERRRRRRGGSVDDVDDARRFM